MAFSFSNIATKDQVVKTVGLGMVTNYAKIKDEPQEAVLGNKTCSNEQPEKVTYTSKPIKKVLVDMPIKHPAPTKDGVLYTIKVETIDRQEVAGVAVDEPIAAWLTIAHPLSNTWDNAKVATVVNRLLSACVKGQTGTGTAAEVGADDWRFEDLMKSALVPTVD